MRLRWSVRSLLLVGLSAMALVGAATASASVSYSCSPSSAYIQGSDSVTFNGGSCTVSGAIPAGTTLTLEAGTGVTVASGSSNAGTIVFAPNDGASSFDTAAGGTFTNSGTIVDETDGNGQDLYAGTLDNSGTIEAANSGGGQLLITDNSDAGTFVNENGGNIVAEDGATLSFNDPMSLTMQPGSTATNEPGGMLKLYATSMDVQGGTITGAMTDFQSNLTFESSASSSTGTINGESSFSLAGTIPQGVTLTESGGGITAATGAGNAGTFLFEGGNPGLAATGTFVNSGTLGLTTGELQITSGTLRSTGTIGVPAGTALYVNNGNLVLSGSSTVDVGVAGTGLSQFGFIRVSGSATLAGTLNAALGYTPAIGDTQQILGAGSISGTFGKTLGTNSSGFYTVQYTPTTATLTTTAGSTSTSTATRRPTAGSISGKDGKLSLKLSCAKGTGACEKVSVTATVTETLKGKKLVAVAASKKSKTTKRVVTIAKQTVSRAAGVSKTLTITLNAMGKALLKKYGTLTTRVTVTSGGKIIRTEEVKLHAVKTKKKARSLRV
jgi:hypothetical protein